MATTKKITITIPEELYDRLAAAAGAGTIDSISGHVARVISRERDHAEWLALRDSVFGPIAEDPDAARHWQERLAMTPDDYAREADERDAARHQGRGAA